MIRFVKHNDIDFAKWDDCILNALNGYIYAFSWYLDIVSEDWDALIEDDYRSVMPLPFKKRFGMKFCYQPFFCQQLGVFSKDLLGDDKVDLFINEIPKALKHVRVNLNKFNQTRNTNIFVNHRNIELDLIPDYEALSENYHKNLKRNLEKSKDSKLNIVPNVRPEILIDLFKADKGHEFKHLREDSYNRLKRLIYAGMHNGTATTFGVFDQMNQLVSGAVFFDSHQRLIFLFSANSDQGRELFALGNLIDFIIRKNASKNLTLDFEGSDNEGLARFYLGFGAKEYSYSELSLNRMNRLTNMFYSLYQKNKRS